MSDAAAKALGEALAARGAGAREAAAALLSEAHCCAYCVLRLLGIKSLALYQLEPPVLRRALFACVGLSESATSIELSHPTATTEAKTAECAGACDAARDGNGKGKRCCGCADTIARCHDEAFCRELVEAVRGCGYQYECYILNVHLPVAMSIRQHALWLFVHERHP